jgi:hypothetical protein
LTPYAADAKSAATPTHTTDWVLLELRDANHQTVVSHSAFLDMFGYGLDPRGSTGLVVDVSPATNLYLAVKHRNHLTIVSAKPLAFTNVLTAYDFTVSANRYLGGSNACVELEPGVWGMIAGDCDGDGKITAADRAIVEGQMGKTGYLSGDLNLDGKVDGED